MELSQWNHWPRGKAKARTRKRETVLPVELKRGHHQNHNYFPLAIDHWYACCAISKISHLVCMSQQNKKIDRFSTRLVFFTMYWMCVGNSMCAEYTYVCTLYTNFQSMHFCHAIPQKVFIGLVRELCDYVIYDSIHPFNGTSTSTNKILYCHVKPKAAISTYGRFTHANSFRSLIGPDLNGPANISDQVNHRNIIINLLRVICF